MPAPEVDEVAFGNLRLLQENAHNTAPEKDHSGTVVSG